MILYLDFSRDRNGQVCYEIALRDAGVLERRCTVQATREKKGENTQTIQSSALCVIQLSKEMFNK
jgi:hypothetical protein